MSDKDKKVDPNLKEVEDKTSIKNEKSEDKKELNPETLLAQKLAKDKKLDKLQEEFDEYKTNNPQKPKGEVKVGKDTSSLEAKIELIEFAQIHRDIAGEDIKEIIDVAKAKGITADEALELPMIKNHLEAKAKAKAVADAMPNNDRGSKGQPDKPVNEMSRGEHKKYFDDLMDN